MGRNASKPVPTLGSPSSISVSVLPVTGVDRDEVLPTVDMISASVLKGLKRHIATKNVESFKSILNRDLGSDVGVWHSILNRDVCSDLRVLPLSSVVNEVINKLDANTGDTLLSSLCRTDPPDLRLLSALLSFLSQNGHPKATLDVPARDGLTPLFLVSRCRGGTSADAAALLLAHGAQQVVEKATSTSDYVCKTTLGGGASLRSYCEATISEGKKEESSSSSTKWPVPKRFVNGTKSDPPGTAEKRWAATMQWRKAEKIDTCILQPHPHYETIKRGYPHFFGRKDISGTQLCYFERPGFLELKTLGKIGVPAMVRHYVFQIEFCWTYMAPSEDMHTLSGVDVQNVGLYDLKGIAKEFVAAVSKVSQEHYPERAGKICVLNAPGWFSMLWNIIKLGLHPNTQKKVFILSASQLQDTMRTVIAEGDLPFEYGGTLKYVHGESASCNGGVWEGPLGPEKEAARWCSEVEVAIADFVKKLNTKAKLPLPPAAAWKREDVTTTKEDFLKAYEYGWEEHESELHLPIAQWRPDRWPGCLFVGKK